MGDLGRGGADGVGGRRLRLRMLGAHQAAVQRIALGAGDDAVHHRHGFEGIVAAGRFGRQHHGVGAVVDRGRHVRGLGPGRRRGMDHGFQHLGRDDHRLAGQAAGADDPLLGAGHVLGRHLHAEIAARHHDASESWISSSRWASAAGFSILTMIAARLPISRRASATSSGRWTKESAIQSAPMSRPNWRSARSLSVSGDRAEDDVGQVDALAVAEAPAGDDDRVGIVGRRRLDPEADLAVVEEELGAGLEGRQHFGMG